MIKVKNKDYFHFYLFFNFIKLFNTSSFIRKYNSFYHDVLDAGVVYNSVLGKFYSGERDAFNIFLNGNIEAYYMQYLLKPFSLIYGILNTELAYWTTDFLIKITSYISFFILAKKISKNYFVSCLTSCVYAYFNSNALNGFGTSIFPYLVYLSLFRNNLNIKHYLIVFIFGINSDIVSSLLFSPILLILIFCFKKELILKKTIFLVKLISVFYLAMIITSINLIYLFFSI